MPEMGDLIGAQVYVEQGPDGIPTEYGHVTNWSRIGVFTNPWGTRQFVPWHRVVRIELDERESR